MNLNKYEYKATILRVVDGDTVDLEVDLGFNIKTKQRFRLFGINAPESRTKNLKEKVKGKAATKYLITLLEKFSYIKTIKDSRGKYGRYLVELYNSDNVCINNIMVKAGHAIEQEY